LTARRQLLGGHGFLQRRNCRRLRRRAGRQQMPFDDSCSGGHGFFIGKQLPSGCGLLPGSQQMPFDDNWPGGQPGSFGLSHLPSGPGIVPSGQHWLA
jgi:hypothetical protein